MTDEEFKTRLVEALERIATVIEGTSDENNLIHVYLEAPEEETAEEEDAPEEPDGVS